MPDFSTYVPPGVYVEEAQSPLVSIAGTTPAVVGIVGPAIGYRIGTEVIVLTGTTPVTLAKLGIDTGLGFEVRAADGSLYTGSDYTLVQPESGEAGTQDNETTIERADPSGITSGATVYLTYHYTDGDYLRPFWATDYDTVKDVFGEPLDLSTGAILSPLSLAAKACFENGARRAILVATPTASEVTREELQTAMAKLSAVPEVNIVVPLPVGITGTTIAPGDVMNIGADLKQHVEDSSNNDRVYRVGIIGWETTVTTDAPTVAQSIGSRRVMAIWPNKVLYYNGFANQVITIGGYYLAAAAAGRMAALGPSTPLTRKQLRSFSGLSSDVLAQMTVAQKNTLSAAGLAVVEYDRNQRLIIRHGVSTDPSSLLTREISLVRQRDAMMQLISDTIDAAGLIGSTIDLDTPIRIKGVIQGCLETLIGADTIVAYKDVKVRQLSLDPTVIEVKYEYQPAYPLNYIVVSFQVSTMTGDLTFAA